LFKSCKERGREVNELEKRYYNLKEICEYLGLKPKQVYWLRHKRKIPYIKLGKARRHRLLFDKTEIDKWMNKNTVVRYKDIEKEI